MPPPLTICHIILRLDFGGLENGLVMLINNMPAERYRHVVVCLEHATEFRARIRRDDVAVHEVRKRPGKDLGAYGRVRDLLRGLRPDVVHTRNLPTVDMLAPARLAGVRALVHSEHGVDAAELAGVPLKYKLLRRASRLLVRRYIAVSKDLARWMTADIGLPRERISVVYNGVDQRSFRPRTEADGPRDSLLPPGFVPEEGFLLGTIGRLEAVKDQTNLVRGVLRALERRPDLRETLRLAVIGDGSLRAEMEALLEAAGAGALAWMPGFRDDAAALYRSFDLFALPSRREGTSNTVLEAMASGLPVVATDVGGNPDLVVPGETGCLVPAQDPDALAEAIVRYADDRALAARHGAAGRDKVLREFSLDAMVEGYGAVYETVAASGASRP